MDVCKMMSVMAHHRSLTSSLSFFRVPAWRFVPGIALCGAISLAAILAESAQVRLAGHAWLGDLVVAIVFGVLLRSFARLPEATGAGIKFSAKTLLEVAVVLLGASLSLSILKGAGGLLILGIAIIVGLSLIGSYAISRAIGLEPKLAILVACGNSICGNSAIAAAAPAIGAKAQDVASAIAFTAVLGVAAVIIMPAIPGVFSMDAVHYGLFAGMTVYAVPQVLAATAPMGAVAVQTGTVVKLIRVLMLGPVVTTLSIIHGRGASGRLDLQRMVPWFIIGFVLMIMARSFGLIPNIALAPISGLANVLTIMSMAALGLSVDIRSLRHAGGKVIVAATASLLLLCALSVGLIAIAG